MQDGVTSGRGPRPAAPGSGNPGPAAAGTRSRDLVIDVARVGSMGVVLLLHAVYLRVTVVDGEVRTEYALGGAFVWALTWLLQVLPLLFLVSGYAATVALDRSGERGVPVTGHLSARAVRLLSPLLVYLAVASLAVLLLALVDSDAAALLGGRAGDHLWFVTAYLWCVLVTPTLVRLHDRWGPWPVPAALLGGAVAVDLLRFGGWLPVDHARWLGVALVWGCCHQLGVVLARGALLAWSTTRLVGLAVAGVVSLVVMVGPGPWFPTTIGLADTEGSNLAPPTAAMAVLGLTQLGVLALVARRYGARSPGPRLARVLDWGSPRLVLVYLWHVPALALVTYLASAAPGLLLPAEPREWWLLRPVVLLLAAGLLWVLVTAAGGWERHLLLTRTPRAGWWVPLALVGGLVGSAVIWRTGLGVDTGSLLAVGVVALAVVATTRPAAG